MTAPRQTQRTGLRWAVSAALGVAGFLAANLAVHAFVDWEPFIPSFSERMEFYRERQDQFSLLFVGSSRIRAHVNPPLVDALLEETGLRHRSFNIGVDALSLIELNSIIDEIARLRPPALDYVAIEPVFSTDVPRASLTSERSIYFHTIPNTALEISCNIRLPSMRWSVGRSLLAGAHNLFNVGRLTDLFHVPGAVGADPLPLSVLSELRGYESQENVVSAELLEWRERFVEKIDEFAVVMREERALEPHERFDMPCQFEAVRSMAARLRAAGIQPIFLHTPGFLWINDSLSFEEYLREKGDPTPLLSYMRGNDDLYHPELWYDHRHLTAGGAEIFSRRLAGDLAGFLGVETGELSGLR